MTLRFCPVCDRWVLRFRTAQGRRAAACPRCGSLERHRHLMLYLQRRLDIETVPRRVVHVAPDHAIDARLQSLPNLDYVSGDIADDRGSTHVDLTALPFPDASCDLLIAFHVLEHIPDDGAAFAEIRRVLTPDGVALLQVPLREGPTYEDPTVTTPEGRLEHFGQADHVRVYGTDFADRAARGGLPIGPDVFRDELTAAEQTRYGLVYVDDPDPRRDALWTIMCSPAPAPPPAGPAR